ncbi:GAF domain nucleotide-binding protein [Podospora conica]|nr:GAF domain nucleotide-binding protein [Schizothecium conicum]
MQVSHLDFSNHHFPSQPSDPDAFHHHHQHAHHGDQHLGLNIFSSPSLDSLTHLTPSSFGRPSHISGSSYGHGHATASSGSSPSAGQDSTSYPGLTLPKKPKRGRPPVLDAARRSASPDPETVVKRQRNNVAAKKYRQKKIDRIQELEEVVDEVKRERDELRIRLARQEAETEALREMLKMKMGGGA